MIQETIAKIEARLQESDAVTGPAREEMLALVGTLKREVLELSKTDTEQALRIADLTQASTHTATAQPPSPESLRHTLDELAASVQGFEDSHPRLVQIVNRIATTLANLGI
jgi:hypothetical protein